jgi:DNA repair protein RecN (Recombination protein N)
VLVELTIKNLAIIDTLRLPFEPGFNVLTGETGAGKSIIIDAVNLLLGGRASAEIIRTGCESATVEGVFSPPAEVLAVLNPLLEEAGLLEETGELILRREVIRDKRHICRINGHTVPLSLLQEIGHHLVDIHGQGDHLSLLQVRRHIDFLDRFGGLLAQRQKVGALVHALRQVQSALQALQRDARELARRVDLLNYQIQEINAAALRPDEEAELQRERNLLVNAEKLMRLSAEAYQLLAEGEEEQRSVMDLLAAVVDALVALARVDETLREPQQTAEGILYQLEELARMLRRYRDDLEYDPQRLEAVEERLELIHNLKRKYGESIAEVLEFAARAQAELEQISHSEERQEELRVQEQSLMAQIAAEGLALSQARRAAAQTLQARIEAELAELNMERARFLIAMRWEEDPEGVELEGKRYAFDATGLDRVEFLIAPNPGEEPKPLAKIASGGETSRLMLAMKTALSAADPVPTLIFDEIDAGIGGRTGSIVGRKLWTLAQNHQVFCVTHLAQMACYGRSHFRVTKEVIGGRTISTARLLSPAERVDELALMLGGAVTEATRRSAAELLQRAQDPSSAQEST